ncbi:TRAP transporter fused permease subunit [Pikeienuella piscinae]|uniref:TRAP transporter fused permease subunit n=1 Tax=Pikeienuella piscinae TaxID=2748098 RepID=A0A7L5BX58_9RHOB|nr:TRAP transporter fused permease subunit [Pikeienuella piscinae]QIE56495.1 TRAP transporter fused permease subunit [Pikeienuella piscinae]
MTEVTSDSSPVSVRFQRAIAVALGLAVLGAALHAAFFGAPIVYVQRPLFLFAVVACATLLYPSGWLREGSLPEMAFNLAIIGVAAGATVYLVLNWDDLLWESYLSNSERLIAAALLLTVFEGARRTTAKPLIYVASLFVLYAVYGRYFPGILQHAGVTWENVLRVTVLGTDGLFGTPLGFAAGFVTVFVFFTALLNVSGAGAYLLNLAFALAGRWTGGPGKVAVLGSALMGMVSGSGVTNVLTTGTITIPMMKRAGYTPAFAAGVEAVASQGSQFIPPIMGAAVFLMAEYTGVPFLVLAGYCLVPAFLYYLSVFVQVHLRASKMNLRPMNEDEIPTFADNAFKSLIVFGPITLLIVLLFKNFSTDFSIAVTFLSLFATTCLLRETRVFTGERVKAVSLDGVQTLATISVALALAGVVVGMILLTGLGARLTTMIGAISQDSMFLALLATAIVAVVLGMGVVTVGAYVIVASLTAPLLTDMGVPLVIAHLFIFYYATLSGLSPPVAVVIFAAAGVAGAPAIKTAWIAMRLGFVAWLVPFMFTYYPSIIGLDGITLKMVIHVLTATVGVIAFGVAFEGWAFTRATTVQRLLCAAGGVLLFYPAAYLLPAGAGLLAIALILNRRSLPAASVT